MKAEKISKLCVILILILFTCMVFDVLYHYFELKNCQGCSAPPSIAFLSGIPYMMAIVVCFFIVLYIKRKTSEDV